MEFDMALRLFKHGQRLTRVKWEDEESYVYLHSDKRFLKNINFDEGRRHFAYAFSSDDILASDWTVIEQT